MKLTFQQLTEANQQRAEKTNAPLEKIGAGFFAIELAGETGELCNVIKKLERIRLLGNSHPWTVGTSTTVLREQMRREIGDVGIVLDLLCQAYGLKLEDCITVAFNEKSQKLENTSGGNLPRLIAACLSCGGEISDRLCMSCGRCHCNQCLQPSNNL